MSFFGPPIRNGVPIGLGSSIGFGSAPFTPAELFYAGEQGFWYDPTDIPLAWRRNLLTYSEQFENAAWSKTQISVAANTAVAPDGSTTADTISNLAAGGTAYHYTYQSPSLTSSTTYTLSVYVKVKTGSGWIWLLGESSADSFCFFNVSTGVVGTTTGFVSASISSVGNGWYRCIATFTKTNATSTEQIGFGVSQADSVPNWNSTGLAGTQEVYLWGAQLELGSTASTYQQIVTPEISFLQYQSQPVLYQDSAGTTPVTAVEQAVALMLDKSKGLVLGPELVTNGDFSSGTTGWTAGGTTTLSVTSGVMRANGTTDGAFFGQQVSFAANTWYKLTFSSLSDGTSKAAQINLGTTLGSGNRYAGSIAFGTNRSVYYYSSSAETLWVWFYPGFFGTANYILIDDVSCKVAFGNHAFQTTSAKRPVLRARYNLLTYSEQFDNAVWTKTNATVTANSAVAPDGTTTADKLVSAAATAHERAEQSVTITASTAYTLTAYAKADGANFLGFRVAQDAAPAVWFDLVNGTVGTVESGWSAATITAAGNGWYRCKATYTTVGTSYTFRLFLAESNNSTLFTGDGVKGLFIWGADLRPTSQATGLIGPTYQRIAAATDYDVVGYLSYLAFDGVDDALTTNSIDFSATDKVTLFAGVRKLSDAAASVFAELSASVAANNGAFALFAPDGAAPRYLYQNKGTASGSAQATGYAAPITNVLTGIGDIAGDVSTLRVDGVQAATSATDQGTGNYGNYPLFIGARNQTSLYFNGWLSSLIGRGAATAAGQISATEQWVGGKSGVQI